MKLRCDECRKPITKWQRRRSQLASVGPVNHTAWTAHWVVHLACLRSRRVDRRLAELIGLEETP